MFLTDNVRGNSKMALVFMATSFAYLLFGTIVLSLSLAGMLPIGHDSVFILILYGFVVMIIFGLSYMFAPGFSHTKFADYRLSAAEYLMLNVGVILLFYSFIAASSVQGSQKIAALAAMALIVAAVLLHAVSIWRILMPRGGLAHSPDSAGKPASRSKENI
ncbi:MAG: hypothetical protein LVQ97_05010 [Candidatus Micrarchaeales archaeon]|nr:hypothetical protein [Candidatus Micrarchaeales archaeon]